VFMRLRLGKGVLLQACGSIRSCPQLRSLGFYCHIAVCWWPSADKCFCTWANKQKPLHAVRRGSQFAGCTASAASFGVMNTSSPC
jgi:hypothetical protein